jgi:hypothetical protein
MPVTTYVKSNGNSGENMREPIRQQLKGAFPYCKWCGGSGCMGCDEERRKYQEQRAKPIFSADRDNPDDMEALRRVVGREAIEHAFGPEGGGIAEVEYNAAVESLLQVLRKSRRNVGESEQDATTSPTLARVAEGDES